MVHRVVSPRVRVCISTVVVLTVFLIMLVSVTGWRKTNPLIEEFLAFTGWICIATGVIGRLWCGLYIGGQKNQSLVTSGPYSICRNPLYLFSFLGGLGVALITETVIFPAVFVTLFLLYYTFVIRSEERHLQELFGDEFSAYCDRVPRFWPRIQVADEPATREFSPPHFARCRWEVFWFVVLGALLECMEGFHEVGFLPSYFTLY